MNNNLTEIAIILDCSGSMDSIRNDTIGGFNTLIEEQKKLDGEANITFIQFSDNYKSMCTSKPINEINKLTHDTYIPGGCTALNDAVGKTINSLGQEFSKRSEDKRPAKVLFVIITDGEENASKEYTLEKVNNMITHQKEKYNWEFIFIGTNDLNVSGMANSRGISLDKTYAFDKSMDGTRDMYASVSLATAVFRSGGEVDMSLYNKDR